MSGQNAKKTAKLIKEIANGKEGESFPVMSGKVVAGSLDASAMTIKVLLNVSNEQAPTGGILLNAVSNNVNGVILYPADGSNVWVAELDGPGKWGIVKCSDIVKMVVKVGDGTELTITDGKIQMNDGSLGGLVVLAKLNDNLNALKIYIKTTLEGAIVQGLNAVGVGSAANGPAGATAFNGATSGQEINFENMENTNIKQG